MVSHRIRNAENAGPADRLVFKPVAALVLALAAKGQGAGCAWIALVLSVAMSAVAVALFLLPNLGAPIVAAVAVLIGMISERLARDMFAESTAPDAIPGLVASETVAPWLTLAPTAALVHSSVSGTEQLAALTWATVFVLVHYLDITVPRMVLKARGAYSTLYPPHPGPLDRTLAGVSKAFGSRGYNTAVFGRSEQVVLVLVIAPVYGVFLPCLIAACVLGSISFVFQLSTEVASVKLALATDPGQS